MVEVLMKKVTRVLLSVLLTSLSLTTYAEKNFLPEVIYQLDSKFTHHILVVEKNTHTLHLYKNDEGNASLIKTYKIATGKITGNKSVEGDKKTPEGVYFFQKFLSSDQLHNKYGDYAKIYGAGAFTLDYPNEMDKRNGKTGHGIWLHSTDDDARVSKGLDSRGCVVAIDADLKDISQYIDLKNTATIIVQDLKYLSKSNWKKNKEDIQSLISSWATAWQTKDFDGYINSYSKAEFKHPRRGRYQAFKNYKRGVFARKDNPTITFSNTSILSNGDYVVVTLEQDYQSPIINDIGKKTLILKKNASYQWKIISETWSKIQNDRDIAFTPSMRYFDNKKKEEMTNDTGSI